MKKGEVARLTMTGDYAYGATGLYAPTPPSLFSTERNSQFVRVDSCSPAWGIGPNATLMFEMEVLEIK
jgi:FKBP-type peptidyl-prolyl cis-trans isomerase